jgi:TetR/AcrR family transcriptional regulator, transcriptional repressor for nem operon
MKPRAAQKADSRRAILQSAAALVRERGAAGTSVQDAMAGAGLTVGAFYAHFADKDELLGRAFDLALDDARGLVEEAAAGARGADALCAVVSRYLSEEHRDDVRRGCPLPAMLGEAARSAPPALRARLARGVETMRERVAGTAPGHIDAETALALVALMVGGQIVARAVRGTPVSSRVLAASRSAGARLARRPSGARP